MGFKRGTRVSLKEIMGYEMYKGRKGTIIGFDRGTKTFLVSMDLPISGSYEFMCSSEELLEV